MNIDWFTVIAQILNFLILVWLMKRFLYKPVLTAIDERESKISSELKDAASRMEEAERSKVEFRKKNEEIERQRTVLLSKAEEEAKSELVKLLNGARQEAALLRQKLQEDLKEEQQRLNKEISYRIQKEVFDLSRKVLNDLASVNIEEQVIEIFVKRLNEIDKKDSEKIVSAFKISDAPAIISASFAISLKGKELIENAVRKIYSQANIQFSVVKEPIGGVELIVNGVKIGWNVQDYLSLMEQHLSELLNEHSDVEAVKNFK